MQKLIKTWRKTAMSEKYDDLWKKQPMLKPFISKVTVNMSVGQAGEKIQNASKVLESLAGQKPVMLKAKQTIREWGIHKHETIACKVTLRGEKAFTFLKKSLDLMELKIPEKSVDRNGNFSFGLREHIELDLPGAKYDPNLGIFGMDIAVTFEKPGFRTSRRRIKRQKIPKRQRVTLEEVKYIMKNDFNTLVEVPVEEEDEW
ncbi:MAG: 50S ribosomal protein L5 [Candidatus Ranarchaeia archaeon]